MVGDDKHEPPCATMSTVKAVLAHVVVLCLAACLAYLGFRFVVVHADRFAQLAEGKFWAFSIVYLTSVLLAIGATLWCLAIMASLLKAAIRSRSKKDRNDDNHR
jgi:TRAP-type C4-dicarboxylate transport system permease small subunit